MKRINVVMIVTIIILLLINYINAIMNTPPTIAIDLRVTEINEDNIKIYWG